MKKILTALCFFFSSTVYAEAPVTKLEVHNVFNSVSIKLQVKCDYDSKLKRYTYYKITTIPRSSKTTISAPVGLKRCEIWPIGIKFFGDIK